MALPVKRHTFDSSNAEWVFFLWNRVRKTTAMVESWSSIKTHQIQQSWDCQTNWRSCIDMVLCVFVNEASLLVFFVMLNNWWWMCLYVCVWKLCLVDACAAERESHAAWWVCNSYWYALHSVCGTEVYCRWLNSAIHVVLCIWSGRVRKWQICTTCTRYGNVSGWVSRSVDR